MTTKWSEVKRQLDPAGTTRVADRAHVMASAEDAYQRGLDDALADLDLAVRRYRIQKELNALFLISLLNGAAIILLGLAVILK